MNDLPGNVLPIVHPTDEEIVTLIKSAANDSINVYFTYYVDGVLKDLDYSHLQILKLIKSGEFTRITPERGCTDSCGFTVCLKFGGEIEACHIRGWFDISTQRILIADVFISTQITA